MICTITKKGSNLSKNERQPPPKNSGAIVSGESKVMVPTGRLELPRIAPLAPQASVSTNSTTSALRENRLTASRAQARQPAPQAPEPNWRRSAQPVQAPQESAQAQCY